MPDHEPDHPSQIHQRRYSVVVLENMSPDLVAPRFTISLSIIECTLDADYYRPTEELYLDWTSRNDFIAAALAAYGALVEGERVTRGMPLAEL